MGAERVVRLAGADGVEVEGDLVVGDGAWAGAVVCHPHPDYGGDRRNLVVGAVFRALADAGATALRFDFRRTASGERGEERDIVAAIDEVAGHLPPGRPLWLVGYSFGADQALAVGDDRVAGWAAIAPPLRFGSTPRAAEGDPRPVLVLGAAHDQFHPPDRLRPAVAGWPDVTVDVVPGADHFLVGASDRVAATVLTWLRTRSTLPTSSPDDTPSS
jgi:hypothetical protein